MPLYAVWHTGSVSEIVFYGLHCTLGDLLIATAVLLTATTFAGGPSWPEENGLRVAIAAIALGLAYTAYSEWLNVYVRKSWAYSELMPFIPWTGIGLSPMMQWIVVPALGYVVAFRSLGLQQ